MKWFTLFLLTSQLCALPLPQDIECIFTEAYGFPERPMYVELAADGPSMWTMELYEINSNGNLVFYTDTSSSKWETLRKSTSAVVMFKHPGEEHGGVIKARGRVCLRRGDRVDHERLHAGMVPYVKGQDPSRMGVIEVIPTSWQVFDAHPTCYGESNNFQYVWQCNCWQIVQVSPF